MVILRKFISVIDWLSEWTGRAVSWVAVAIMLTMTFEVTTRYVFNNPTAWSYDTTIMMGGVLFLLSTAYVMLVRGNVRVDIFYARFSLRKQALVDLIFTVLYLFGAMYIFTVQGWERAFWSYSVKEISQFGYWEPTMVPFRFFIAFGFSLLSLQTISWSTKNLYLAITNKNIV